MTQIDLPVGKNFSQKELTDLFFLIKDTPYDNPDLAYKILIPKTFEAEKIRSEDGLLNSINLKPLGIFRGPEEGGANPTIQIQAVQLKKEITAANWLRHYAIITDRKIPAVKPVSDNFADSLMEFLIAERKFTGRATASIDGDRLFFLLNLTLDSTYDKYKELFGVSVVSFNLQQRSLKQSIENHILYNLHDIIQFRYPESWKYRLPEDMPFGKKGIDLFNFDPDGNICGKIRVKTVEKGVSKGVDTQFKDTLDEYREAGVSKGKLLETINVEIGDDRFDSAIINVYKGDIEGNEMGQEMWIAVIEEPKYYIVVSLLTPFREQLFYVWAINRKAYDIVLGTLV